MKKCKVENCDNIYLAKGYCSRHYRQIKRKGCIYPTFLDGNEIVDYRNGTIGIVLYNRESMPIKTSLASKKDLAIIKKHRWCVFDGYVCTSINR